MDPGKYTLAWGGPWQRRIIMESPPRLGPETMNIAPFMEGMIFYQSTCSKFRYGDGKVLDT